MQFAQPPSPATAAATEKTGTITRRAVLVGLAGTVLLGVATPYSDLFLRGTWIAACHLPIGAFTIFLLILVLPRLALGVLARPLRLSRQEVLVSYCMMLAGAGIPSFGLTEYLIPTMAGAFYFETPENNWRLLFFRHIPQWFVPVDMRAYPEVAKGLSLGWVYALYDHLPPFLQPASPAIIRSFYEGLPQGQGMSLLRLAAAIPWGAWLVPLVAWTVMAYVVFWVVLCLSVIIRKQWVDRERLTYPLVQLPLEMVGREGEAGLSAFFRNRLMWMGFAIPMVLHGINGLHYYNPAVPEVPLSTDLGRYFAVWPWHQIGMLGIWTHFSVIGFSFLLPAELSFSLWLFFFIYKLEAVLITALGYDVAYIPNYPVPAFAAYQMLGAFFALALGMAWAARPHLARLWYLARHPEVSDPEQDQEAISYRAALRGLAGGLALLVVMTGLAGLNPLLGVVVFVFFLLTLLVLSRFVAEGGLLFIQAPFRPTDIMAVAIGTGPLGTQNLAVLAYLERGLSMFDLRGFLLPFLNDIWKMTGLAGLSRRRLLPALIAAVAAATVTSYVTLVLLAYRHGAVTMEPWFAIWSPQQPFQVLKSYLENPLKPNFAGLQLFGLGTLVMWWLLLARANFPWWPLHPIGYAMGPSWPMIQLWFSILVGWSLKAVLLHFGGMPAFRAARPAFLGLVLGEFVAAALWIVIDTISGVHGHRMFLF